MTHLLLASILLIQSGEIDALKGNILHAPGVLAGEADGQVYSHKAPDKNIDKPRNAKTFVSAESCKKDKKIDTKLPLQKGESAVAEMTGALGAMKKATVLLVRGPSEDDMFGYAPIYVRVYDAKKKLAGSVEIPPDVYPCSLALDDFDGKPGNEVAVGWISVGAGYTTGATIFEATTPKK